MQKSDYCSDVDARDRNLYHNNLLMEGILSCFTLKKYFLLKGFSVQW